MGPLDALWHLANFFAPALGVGLIASVITKLLWRRALAKVPLARLVGWSTTSGALVLIAGLLLTGRDGRMATYTALVLACALSLAWAGFRGR